MMGQPPPEGSRGLRRGPEGSKGPEGSRGPEGVQKAPGVPEGVQKAPGPPRGPGAPDQFLQVLKGTVELTGVV